jgi:hypothetical protein
MRNSGIFKLVRALPCKFLRSAGYDTGLIIEALRPKFDSVACTTEPNEGARPFLFVPLIPVLLPGCNSMHHRGAGENRLSAAQDGTGVDDRFPGCNVSAKTRRLDSTGDTYRTVLYGGVAR